MVQSKNRRLVTESALELFVDTQAATPVATLAELPAANSGNMGLIRFVTSENEPYYSNGTTWSSISQGAQGVPGPAGAGVPTGGEALQIIRKNSVGTTTEWVTLSKAIVGLSNVDNTSDMDKPVSTIQKLALDEKLDAAKLPDEFDGVNKNLIEDPASLTAGALSAAIDASVAPVRVDITAAEARLRSEAATLTRFWPSMKDAGTSPVDILVVADSVGEGTGATAVQNRWISKVLTKLRAWYQPAGVVGGVGYIPANYAISPPVADGFTKAGNVTTSIAGGLGLRRSLLNDATASITTTQTCTSFTIYFTNNTVGIKFNVSIDGGAPIVVNQPAAPPSGYGVSWASPALTPGSHTVKIGYEAGTSAAPSIEGVMFYNGDEAKGIRLWDGAHAGFTSASFSANQNWRGPFAQAAGPTPDVVMIALGYNDMGINMAPVTFKANLKTIITQIRTTRPGVPVVIVANPTRPGTFTYTWSDYLNAMKEITTEEVFVTMFDLQPLMPEDFWTNYNADALHPNDAGYALMANAVAPFLLPR